MYTKNDTTYSITIVSLSDVIVLVDVKHSPHCAERMFVGEECYGVHRERTNDHSDDASIEGSPAAFPIYLLRTASPAGVARIAGAVRLHTTLDHVYRQIVPRHRACRTAGKQHHSYTETYDVGLMIIM